MEDRRFDAKHSADLANAMDLIKRAPEAIRGWGHSHERLQWHAFTHLRYMETQALFARGGNPKSGDPEAQNTSKGGYAIWGPSQVRQIFPFLNEIRINDELIPHFAPAPHPDCYYWTMTLDPIDETQFEADIGKLTGSLTYDRLSRELKVRCHFEGANIATLYLASHLARGKMNIGDAIQSYGPLIKALSKERKNPQANGVKDVIQLPWHRILLEYLEHYHHHENMATLSRAQITDQDPPIW